VKPEIAIPASYVSPIAAKTAFLKNTLEDTMRSVLKVVLAVVALAALGILTVFTVSCGSSQTQVRFVQAIWDTSTGAGLDIYFNNTRYFDDLQFLGHGPGSGYTAVPSGSDTIEGFPTGQTSNPSFENEDQSLSSGTEYTLVATGNIINVNNVEIIKAADDNTEPADGTVNFRLIDASPDGPATIYAYLVPNPVVGNGCDQGTEISLSYPSISGYQGLPYNSSGGYTLFLCNAEGGNPLFSGTNLGTIGGPSEGSIRTIILTDNSTGTYVSSSPIILDDLN
jgi:hypothetical protein